MLSAFSIHKSLPKQVCLLCRCFSISSSKCHFSSATSLSDPSSFGAQRNDTCFDIPSSCFSGIAQSVITKCSFLLKNDKTKDFANASLKHLLSEISDVVPEYTRGFLRVLKLKPEDVLHILLGFRSESKIVGLETGKVGALWELFKRVGKQNVGFKHLPQSCEVMASMLLQARLFQEVEILLSIVEREGILLDNHQIFSDLIEEYAAIGELEGAISIYDRTKLRNLVPSLSACCVILNRLVQTGKTQLAYQVCLDMVDMGIDLSSMGKGTFDKVITLLCADGKVLEARNLVKKIVVFGFKPSSSSLNEIAYGYCDKRDFDDLLSFFFETKCSLDILGGNRILHKLCSYFGAERADSYLQELEYLGFVPDEITFGILISWSCHEGNLKKAFNYLSEVFSRGLKPHVHSYNAVISKVFQKGMWKHAWYIYDEMIEKGTKPNLSTFRILLAGYCQARQFDEAKITFCKMENCGFINDSSLNHKLSEVFCILGFSPNSVKLKRDNDLGFSRTEFFDSLGNGLYLDADLDDYKRRVAEILEDHTLPDYQSLIVHECIHGNLRGALKLADEMVHWGQELSISVFSRLLKGLSDSAYPIKAITNILEKNLKLVPCLDGGTLNLLVQVYSKKGLTYNSKMILDIMFQRHIKVKNETYSMLIKSLCKKGNSRNICGCWDHSLEDGWFPGLTDCETLLKFLCKKEMVKEALQLFESMLVLCPLSRSDIYRLFQQRLCDSNLTRVAHLLLEELEQRGCTMDHVAYSCLIKGMHKEKNFSAAFELLDNMFAKNLAPCLDVSCLLIPPLCKADREDKATALKEINLRQQPLFSVSIDNALIEGFCKRGKVGEAANLFQNLLLKELYLDAETCSILVRGFCKVNNLGKVGEFLGVMIRRSLKLSISAYRSLVRVMCVEGKIHHALRLTEIMLGQSKSNEIMIYNILIFYLFFSGNSQFVNNILDDLQDKKVFLDEVTYDFLVHGFSKCRDVSSMVHYLTAMISKGLRPSKRSLRKAIISLCNYVDLEKALKLSREMESRGWMHDSIIQNEIVWALISHGKLQEAEIYLDRLEKKCLIPGNINYDNLIKCFCLHGRLHKAINLLNIMLKKGNCPSPVSYEYVISSCCAKNNLEEAMDFHIEMLDRDLKPRINTWNMIVHHLCKDGQTEKAERILNCMVHVGETPTREMYSSIINRYRFENNLSKTSEFVQAMQRNGHEPDFETHWSFISNLGNSNNRSHSDSSQGFLSRLLSRSGFSRKK